MYGGHKFSLRIKGNICLSHLFFTQFVAVNSLLGCCNDQCCLCGVSLCSGCTCPPKQLRITAQCTSNKRLPAMPTPWNPQFLHCHLVLCQSSRLIRTDDAGTPQRLHRRQPLYNGAPLCHSAYSQRQHNGDNGRQSFWYGCHSQRNCCHKHIQHVFSLNQSHTKHHSTDTKANKGQCFRDFSHFLLQRGFTPLVI